MIIIIIIIIITINPQWFLEMYTIFLYVCLSPVQKCLGHDMMTRGRLVWLHKRIACDACLIGLG